MGTVLPVRIGVDTHTDVHVAAALDGLGGLLGTCSVSADRWGYERLLRWAGAFAHSLLPKIGGLPREPERCLAYYNEERAHTGRCTHGRTPWRTLIGARKMRLR